MIGKEKLEEVKELQIATIGEDPENITEFFDGKDVDENALLAVVGVACAKIALIGRMFQDPARSHAAAGLWGVVFGLLLADEVQAQRFAAELEREL